MSGRLVILPKKSYCPWKPENVERVLRDERLEAERLKTTKSTARSDRLAILKREKDPSHLQHVNLFQREEDEAFRLKGIVSSSNGLHERKPQVGVAPIVLEQSELEPRGKFGPFYLQLSNDDVLHPKEEQRKDSLDPMKAFVQKKQLTPSTILKHDGSGSSDSTNQHFKKKKRRSNKRHRINEHDDGQCQRQRKARKSAFSPRHEKPMESLEELRQRRLEREAIEYQRSCALTLDMDYNGKRSIDEQFYPRQSRR